MTTCDYSSGLCPRPHGACGEPAVETLSVSCDRKRSACERHRDDLWDQWRTYIKTFVSGDGLYKIPPNDFWLKNTYPNCIGPDCPRHKWFGCDRPVVYRATVTVEDERGRMFTFTAWSCETHRSIIRNLADGRFKRGK